MDTHLAGEGDALGGRQEAVERPVLGARGERAAQCCDSARCILCAGGGCVQSLAVPPLGVSSLAVATEDVVGLAAADEGEGIVVAEGRFAVFDGFVDCRHPGNAAQQFGPQGITQEAAHDTALVDATGDALPPEFMDELVQPEMDGDRARAKRCALRSVEHPFVRENISRSVLRGGCWGGGSGLGFGLAGRWLDHTEGLFGGGEE